MEIVTCDLKLNQVEVVELWLLHDESSTIRRTRKLSSRLHGSFYGTCYFHVPMNWSFCKKFNEIFQPEVSFLFFMFFFFAVWLWREMNIFIGTSDLWECWSSGKTDSRNIILNYFFFANISQLFADPLSLSASDPRTSNFSLSRDPLETYEALDKKSFQGRLPPWHISAAVDRKVKFAVFEGDGKKKSATDEWKCDKKCDGWQGN